MKLEEITNNITKKITEYIEFDIKELFNQSDCITIYGGAVRDSIAGLDIHDVDILCMPKSAEILRTFLINCKDYKIIDLYDIDTLNMYKGISIIQDPWTLINKNNKIIQIIRPSFGDVRKLDAYKLYKNAYHSLIKNVDLSCCGVFIEKCYDIILLKESCKDAIIQCLSKTFQVNNWATLYNIERTNFRENKLTKRGWTNLEPSYYIRITNLINNKKIKIERMMKILSLELKPNYNYKIWTDDEYEKYYKSDIKNDYPF